MIVAAQHRIWWERELQDLPLRNQIVQPQNRGTAVGVLLPLFVIHARDPEAEVVILPSDHFVDRADVLSSSIEEALLVVHKSRHRIVLLGVAPEEADPGYGWILPVEPLGPSILKRVATFVEKPDERTARELMGKGALINAFLLVARSQSLLRLYQRQPVLLRAFGSITWNSAADTVDSDLLARLYESLQSFDFSRDILQGSSVRELRVLAVPPCGWTDVGTPRRVVACLHRTHGSSLLQGCGPTAPLDLAEVAKAVLRDGLGAAHGTPGREEGRHLPAA